MSKNIALFIDGTWNDADKKDATNVLKLYRAALVRADQYYNDCGIPLANSGSTQVVHYLDGVGTGGIIDWVLGGATGFGTAERIKEAYLFLALNYNPDHEDNVYLFGFSRGAFAARAVAGFVGLVGLLFKDEASWGNVEAAYRVYERKISEEESGIYTLVRELKLPIRLVLEPPRPIPIRFIGVWDTVKALGVNVGNTNLTKHWTEHHDNPKLPKHITHARHALALHELRPEFEPTLWEDWDDPPQSLEQVWFPGAHADVGGGYAKTDLSDVALRWIAWESAKYGLKWFFAKPLSVSGASSGTVHYETMVDPLATREILSDWKSPPLKTKMIESFFMHETACMQLLSATPRQFRFANEEERALLDRFVAEATRTTRDERYRALLDEVDELTLALHLALSFDKKCPKRPIR